jgi:C-terminal processing protease CtpA/Prc
MNTLFIRTTLTLLLLAGMSTGNSQVTLNPVQLREDFSLFKTALQEAHPGLYRYNTREHMDSLFLTTESLLNRDMTQQEFYRILLPVVSQIKCGHTKLHPDNNWSDNYFFERNNLFPLRLTFRNDKAYVLYSYSGDNMVPAGAEIISINEKPVPEIINLLLPGLFSDGANTTFKYIELSKFFSACYANLIGSAQNFSIRYQHGSERNTIIVPAIPFDRMVQSEKQRAAKSTVREPYSLVFPGNNTGVITISSFSSEGKEKYGAFLHRAFDEISNRGIKQLIIDVRDNEGGVDRRGAMLLSYLLDKKFRYYDRLEATTDKKYTFADKAYLPGFYGILRMLLKRTDSGKVLWTHNKNLKVQKPQKNHFDGKVYVLINGASFSVTAEFAAVAHYLKRATFIGEETGGAYYGNNSGAFVIVKLPRSRLNVGIPMLAYYLAVEDYPWPGHGIIPDHYVQPSVSDLIQGRDTVLDFALELSRSQNIVP